METGLQCVVDCWGCGRGGEGWEAVCFSFSLEVLLETGHFPKDKLEQLADESIDYERELSTYS